MIPFYLSILPGEHIYSWWLRRYWLSGAPEKHTYFKEVGVKASELQTNIPLSKSCQKVCKLNARTFDNPQIAQQATEFPLWVLSIDHDRYKYFKSRIHLTQVPAKLHGVHNSGVTSNVVRWKACPNCIEEDLNIYGASYWHVKHQLHGVSVCNKHATPLLVPKKKGRTLDSLHLPHQVDDWELLLETTTPTHYLFSEFCSNLYDLASKDSERLFMLKSEFWKICGSDSKSIKPDKSLTDTLEIELEVDLGASFLSSLFSYYSSPHGCHKRKIVNALASGATSKYVDPVFWLVALFWKRKELGLEKEYANELIASF